MTNEDLDELKGCLDLGFGFSYEIPEIYNTLFAFKLCCSMSQKFLFLNPMVADNIFYDFFFFWVGGVGGVVV